MRTRKSTVPATAGDGGAKASRCVDRDELVRHLELLLDCGRFADYCPNGLQVEGKRRVRRVATAVTASEAAVRAAVAAGADALIVHHGYFWRGDPPGVTGLLRRRLSLILRHELNLLAFHLPLDAHPELGNNAGFGRALGWSVDATFGEHGLGCLARLDRPLGPRALASRVARALDRKPLAVGRPPEAIRAVAWCTGAAQDLLEEAVAAGAQAFVSGEISERTTHVARESGVLYLAAGHHATERFGVRALGEHLERALGVEHRFIDDPNPA